MLGFAEPRLFGLCKYMNNSNTELDTGSLKPGTSKAFFRPMRKTSDGSCPAHYCIPARRANNGQLAIGDAILLEGSMGKALETKTLEKNITWMMTRTITFMRAARSRGDSPAVIVPMNSAALRSKEVASAFTQKCREIDQDMKDQFTVEAFNFPKNMSLGYLDDIAILLYPFSPVYIARPNMGWSDFTVLANCNFQGASIDLHDKPWPIEKAQPYLEDFVRNCQANRLPAYAHGMGTPEIASAAKAAGFDYLDGKVV